MHSTETVDRASVAAAIDRRLQDLGALELGAWFMVPGPLGTRGRVLDPGPLDGEDEVLVEISPFKTMKLRASLRVQPVLPPPEAAE